MKFDAMEEGENKIDNVLTASGRQLAYRKYYLENKGVRNKEEDAEYIAVMERLIKINPCAACSPPYSIL